MNSNLIKILNVILFISVLYACSGYEKLLKSDDYYLKYEKAKEYYNEEEYVKAGTLLEQVAPVFRGTNKADSIAFYQAYCAYQQNDFYTAGFHFKQLVNTFPSSEFIEEATFMIGYCHYLNSPRPALDQQETRKAIEAFQLFLARYPSSEWADDSREYIAEMRDKLVEKSYMNAKLYFDLGQYKSAILALNNSLTDYPDTKYREEIMFLILKSRFLLAEKSVERKKQERYQSTVDDYYSFIAEFDNSEYQKEAERMYEIASSKYDNTNTNLEEE